MVSLLKVLLKFFRILRFAKDRIEHFPRHWVSLLSYLGRKLSEWRGSWPNKPGTCRNPEPTVTSFLGAGVGCCSVSSGSGGLSGFALAASTVPSSSSTNPQSAPLPVGPTPATLSVDSSSRGLSPNPTNQLIGNNPANRSSASIQSRASDRLSIISTQTRNSRASSRASARSGQPTQDTRQDPRPRGTHRQFGRAPSPSRLRDRSSGPPSLIPSPYTAQPHHIEIVQPSAYVHANTDHSRSSSIGPQGPTDSPSLSSHSQWATSIRVNVQNPSTESLPKTPSINAREFGEEPTTMGTPTRSLSRISLADRSETASQHSYAASSASSRMPPEGRIVQLINSEQIPRYTKTITTLSRLFYPGYVVFTFFGRPREENLTFVGPLTTKFP